MQRPAARLRLLDVGGHCRAREAASRRIRLFRGAARHIICCSGLSNLGGFEHGRRVRRHQAAFAGGAAEVAKLTGSRAYERFTGVQMLAVANRFPGAWKSTSHVSLVSSFCASLLSAALQPMDYSDASGTLLMDVSSRKWAKSMLSCKPMESLGLSARLAGEPVPSHQVVGTASPLLSERWGLEPSTIVIASSGDNPCAIAGLGLSEPGDLALSLGTSDTLLGVAPFVGHACIRGSRHGASDRS